MAKHKWVEIDANENLTFLSLDIYPFDPANPPPQTVRWDLYMKRDTDCFKTNAMK
jgi:hypothetical protein